MSEVGSVNAEVGNGNVEVGPGVVPKGWDYAAAKDAAFDEFRRDKFFACLPLVLTA